MGAEYTTSGSTTWCAPWLAKTRREGTEDAPRSLGATGWHLLLDARRFHPVIPAAVRNLLSGPKADAQDCGSTKIRLIRSRSEHKLLVAGDHIFVLSRNLSQIAMGHGDFHFQRPQPGHAGRGLGEAVGYGKLVI